LTAIGPAGRKEPNFAVTDSRDRIYGMLGLAADADVLNIQSDYNANCSKVYTSAVVSLLTQGHISVLDLNQFPKKVKGLPSWVPDWSCPLGGQLQLYESQWYTGEGQVFTASGTSVMSFEILNLSPAQTLLSMVGTRVDTIKSVGVTWRQHWPDEKEEEEPSILVQRGISWLNKLYDLCRKRRRITYLLNGNLSGSPYGTEDQWRSAMIRVSTGDKSQNQMKLNRG
jgi:hypothetical protein